MRYLLCSLLLQLAFGIVVEETCEDGSCKGPRPVLALVVGLEGTGHHMFHSYAKQHRLFFNAQSAAPDSIRYLQPSSSDGRHFEPSRVADLLVRSVLRLEEQPLRADAISEMRAAIQEEFLDNTANRRGTYLLETCSWLLSVHLLLWIALRLNSHLISLH